MKVELLTKQQHFQDMEHNAALAALTCRANTDKDFVPQEVLSRIIKAKHESILEHIVLTYSVKDISRALLQEIARHRFLSLSVESTRHTLRNKLKEFTTLKRDIKNVPINHRDALSQLWYWATEYPNMPNDQLKYLIPEFWPTNLILTANVRELRHIFDLRTAPAALKEFRDLAHAMYDAVPEQFKYLFADCVHEEKAGKSNG